MYKVSCASVQWFVTDNWRSKKHASMWPVLGESVGSCARQQAACLCRLQGSFATALSDWMPHTKDMLDWIMYACRKCSRLIRCSMQLGPGISLLRAEISIRWCEDNSMSNCGCNDNGSSVIRFYDNNPQQFKRTIATCHERKTNMPSGLIVLQAGHGSAHLIGRPKGLQSGGCRGVGLVGLVGVVCLISVRKKHS